MGRVFEVLYHMLLSELGLGAAARPVCDLIADLEGESMTVRQLQQEIRSVLHQHGVSDRSETVIAALVELGFAGLSDPHVIAETFSTEDSGEADDACALQPGSASRGDSPLLSGDATPAIVAAPRSGSHEIHEIAREWLDIDGGIYFDVRQHGAGSDSEK